MEEKQTDLKNRWRYVFAIAIGLSGKGEEQSLEILELLLSKSSAIRIEFNQKLDEIRIWEFVKRLNRETWKLLRNEHLIEAIERCPFTEKSEIVTFSFL